MIDDVETAFVFQYKVIYSWTYKGLFDAVFVLCFQYKVIDDQHKGLFEGILALEKNPGDAGTAKMLTDAVSKHFRDEEVGFVFSIPDSKVTLSIKY